MLNRRPIHVSARNREVLIDNIARLWSPLPDEYPFDLRQSVMDGVSEVKLTQGNDLSVLMRELQDGRLLSVLGYPGSGRTTFLLHLNQRLLEQARVFSEARVPILLSLVGWTKSPRRIEDWLVEELRRWYGVSSAVARNGFQRGWFILLIDDLDQVDEDQFLSCLAGLAGFRRSYPKTAIVVSSSPGDSAALKEQLAIDEQMMLQPLAPADVQAQLPATRHASRAIEDHPGGASLLRLPFWLQAVKHTEFRAGTFNQAVIGAQVQDIILHHWIQSRLKKSGDQAASTDHYLGFLAEHMRRDHLWIFRPTDIQTHWLGSSNESRYLRHQAIFALVAALMVAALTLLLAVVFQLLALMTMGVSFGEGLGYMQSSGFGLIWNDLVAYADSLWLGLATFVLVMLRRAGTLLPDVVGDPFENVSWSWQGAQFGTLLGGVIGIMVGVVGPILGFIFGSLNTVEPVSIFGNGLANFTISLLPGFCLGGLFLQKNAVRPVAASAQQHIRRQRRKLRNGIIFTAAFSASFLVVSAVFRIVEFQFILSQIFSFLPGVSGLLPVILLAIILVFGDSTYLRYKLVSRTLVLTGNLPERLLHFLDAAVEAGLMRPVGSGYQFVHPYVQTYFADRAFHTQHDARLAEDEPFILSSPYRA